MLSLETYVSYKGRKMTFIRNGFQKILILFVFILAMYKIRGRFNKLRWGWATEILTKMLLNMEHDYYMEHE